MGYCEYCKKVLVGKQKKFCSRSCQRHIASRAGGLKGGKLGGHNSQKTLKKLKLGIYDNKNREKGVRAALSLAKKNKTGLFNDKTKIMMIEKAIETNRVNKTGFFDSKLQSRLGKKGGKKSVEINKKNKTGCFFNPKLREIARKKSSTFSGMTHEQHVEMGLMMGHIIGKIGGAKSVESIRNNSPYIFKGIHFSNSLEREIGVNIYYQFGKLIVGKNYQVKVGSLTYDFLINNTFIEFHPWDRRLTPEEYYSWRRENLDNNGFKEYDLLVIK